MREKLEKKRGKYDNVRAAVLSAIGVAGILVVAATMPNVFQALPAFGIGKNRYYNKSVLAKLLKEGFIEFRSEEGKKYLKLTDKGHWKLAMLEIGMGKNKEQKWDGKWRILIFDIKEIQRYQRDRMRAGLIELGFKKLQNSVWVYPYDCEDLLFLLKTYYGFGKSVLYIIADKIENDGWLRDSFALSRK